MWTTRLVVIALTACGGPAPSSGTPGVTAPDEHDASAPVRPTPVGDAAPPSPDTAPAPTTDAAAPTTFEIGLPIRPEDSQQRFFGINPFGVHIGDHGLDGHPGWDFEYKPGSEVLAVADGSIQSVLPSEGGTAWGLQIEHRIGGRPAFRSICGVGTLAKGVVAGAAVTRGQVLGVVASYTRTIGTVTVTYGFRTSSSMTSARTRG